MTQKIDWSKWKYKIYKKKTMDHKDMTSPDNKRLDAWADSILKQDDIQKQKKGEEVQNKNRKE